MAAGANRTVLLNAVKNLPLNIAILKMGAEGFQRSGRSLRLLLDHASWAIGDLWR